MAWLIEVKRASAPLFYLAPGGVLRACCRELGESWKGARTLDLRAKKKDACKVAPEVKDALRRVHMLGAVITKAKKKKGKK